MTIFKQLEGIIFSNAPFTSEDFINKLLPNGIWPFVVQMAVLLVLVFVIYKFLYNPVHNFLEKRAQYVEENIRAAEKAKSEMALKLKEAEEKAMEEQRRSQDFVRQAKADTEIIRARILEEAQNEAEREKERALEEIEYAKAQAMQDIHEEIVSVAFEASKQVIQREINEKDNLRLIDEFVKEVRK
jgi:F-type H+-transporting ATPase subunit b